jgi:ABC-2 type transport system permease protein
MQQPKDSLSEPLTVKKKLYTVAVFTKLSTRRFFRDRLALFFGILFPLIFLFVFGALAGKSGSSVTFNVAVVNQSNTALSKQYAKEADTSNFLKVDHTITSLSAAKNKMVGGQLDATLVLPSNFGKIGSNNIPTGQLQVYYTENNVSAGQTLVAVLQSQLQNVSTKYVKISTPLTVASKELNQNSLSEFDYTFSGLLGFSIVGLGIFGPVNVFPELKKQGILRRLHTTPIRVWQYFLATMASQAIIGLISLAVMFVVAVSVFNLKIVGNYFEIILFLIFSIVMILGIGLAIGGWAKNERQAAPLSNIVVFPMLFLSGTFFPRYAMPLWLQHVTTYLPLTPVIDGVRLLATAGDNLVNVGPQLGLMAVWTVVIYAVAFKVFKWE